MEGRPELVERVAFRSENGTEPVPPKTLKKSAAPALAEAAEIIFGSAIETGLISEKTHVTGEVRVRKQFGAAGYVHLDRHRTLKEIVDYRIR